MFLYNLQNKYLKKIYIFFWVLFIFLITFSTNITYAKTYNVENIEIIEPYDLNFKKSGVTDQAFLKAFDILLSKILLSKDNFIFNKNDLNLIKPMIESFSITDEKFIENKYHATFNVLFEKKEILKFLSTRNIVSSIPENKKIFFIPIFIDLSKDELLMFNENIFYSNWNREKKMFYLLEYFLPTEDLEDFNIINKQKINIENYDFKEILKKYDMNDYIISIFFKDDKNLKILSKINFNSVKPTVISNIYDLNILENKNQIIINNLKLNFEDEWKKNNQINTSIKLNLTIAVKSNNIELINRFEDELIKSDLVYDFYIEKINNKNSIYKIVYNNSPDKFLKNFREKNFDVDISNEVWLIK